MDIQKKWPHQVTQAGGRGTDSEKPAGVPEIRGLHPLDPVGWVPLDLVVAEGAAEEVDLDAGPEGPLQLVHLLPLQLERE